MSDSYKILIIISEYTPYIHPRAHRWRVLAEHWAQAGHDVQVLTAKPKGTISEAIEAGVRVHRVGLSGLKEFVNSFLPSKTHKGVANSGQPKASKLNTVLMFLNDKIWRKLVWPDDAAIWYNAACKKGISIIETEAPDVMISVSLPFTASRVGAFLKTKYPDIAFIADFGDPFSLQKSALSSSQFLYKQKNEKEDLRILQLVDCLTVTTEETKQKYLKFSPQLAQKIAVIPPLLNIETPSENSDLIDFDAHKIHVAYFGSFYPNTREPDALLQIWEHFQQRFELEASTVQLHFFGNINATFLQKINNVPRVTCHGLLDRNAVAACMQKVDFLLNIGNMTTAQLPSKAVDYLRAGKPIIHVNYQKNDLFKAFFDDYPYFLSLDVENNLVQNATNLVTFLTENINQKVDEHYVNQRSEPYLTPAIAAQYMTCIKKVLPTHADNT